MCLFCTCTLCFLLLIETQLVSASISNNFRECSHFFYMQTPPAGIRGTTLKSICQKYADKLRYVTLYDSGRRLPLYSAYIFKKSDGRSRMDTPWMYEPQVWLCFVCLCALVSMLWVAITFQMLHATFSFASPCSWFLMMRLATWKHFLSEQTLPLW